MLNINIFLEIINKKSFLEYQTERNFIIKIGGRQKMNKNLKNKSITLIALIITILFSYDEKLKFSNSKGFLLQTI